MVKAIISERCEDELITELAKKGIRISVPLCAGSYEEEKELGRIAETIYPKDLGYEYGIACCCYCEEKDKDTVIKTCADLIRKPLAEEEAERFSERSRMDEWEKINEQPLEAVFFELNGEASADFRTEETE